MDDDDGGVYGSESRCAAASDEQVKILPAQTAFPCLSRRGRTRKIKLNYALMAALLIAVFAPPYHHSRRKMSSESTILKRSTFSEKRDYYGVQDDVNLPVLSSNDQPIPATKKDDQTYHGLSYAPLFYHISPGSTGSRTLYHAA